MPVKLIIAIALMVLVAVLTGFNLDNKCVIWCFHTFENVPVIGAILGSFVAGVLVTLPFTFGKKRGKTVSSASAALSKREQKKAEKAAKLAGESASSGSVPAAASEAETKTESEK
ncbi:MAG: hypothetical protein IIT68_08250 [Treponema sp.]|nr:hypothetical protein [Treponema sp.]